VVVSVGFAALLVAPALPGALVKVAEISMITSGPTKPHACLDDALDVRARWEAVRESIPVFDGLEDVRGSVDSAVARLAQQLGSACLDPRATRADVCSEQSEQDLEQLLLRVKEHPPLHSSFSGLAWDFALCLEDRSTATCEVPSDDGGSGAALSAAKSELELGRPQDAEGLAEQALALAKAKDDRLSQVRANLLRGEIFDQTEEVKNAREALDDAMSMAIACGASGSVVDAALQRVEVELHHRALGRAELTTLPLKVARDMLDREEPGSLVLRRALYEEKLGGVLSSLEQRCPDSLVHYQSALATREKALEDLRAQGQPERSMLRAVADAELNLATVQLECGTEAPDVVIGRFETARLHLMEALGGQGHPDFATFDFGLGRALATSDRHTEAEPYYRAALATYKKFGAGGNEGDVRVALMEVLRRRGRPEEAMTEARLIVDERRANPATRSAIALADALGAAGVLATDLERYDEAVVLHREAVDLLVRESGTRELDGREREQLAYSHANLALALCGLKQKAPSSEALAEGRKWQIKPSQLDGIEKVLREVGCLS
jgi:tetratricopeptide (TPR) repeat protein